MNSSLGVWPTRGCRGQRQRRRAQTSSDVSPTPPNTRQGIRRPSTNSIESAQSRSPYGSSKQKRPRRTAFNFLIPLRKTWSGRRDSNPRPQPWQGCALPLSYARAPVRPGVLGGFPALGKHGDPPRRPNLTRAGRPALEAPMSSQTRGGALVAPSCTQHLCAGHRPSRIARQWTTSSVNHPQPRRARHRPR